MSRLRIGVVLPLEEERGGAPQPYPVIREMAVAAEEAGLDSIWVFDHLLFRFDGETTGIHEAWTILSAVAEATRRVLLGTLVMCTEFRNPALLAKMAATLDHVSGGRLVLGIGCGWHDPEYEAFGYPADHKVSRFEDSLAIIRGLVRDGRVDHAGRFHEARDAVLVPPARPDLPLLIAAKRPRMLDLATRHADAWNAAWHGLPDEALATKRAALLESCRRTGRDPASIEQTIGVTVAYPDLLEALGESGVLRGPALTGSPADVAAGLAAHAEAGADHVIASLRPGTPEALERFLAAVEAYRAAAPG